MGKGVLGNDPFKRGAAPGSLPKETVPPIQALTGEEVKVPAASAKRSASGPIGTSKKGKKKSLRGWKTRTTKVKEPSAGEGVDQSGDGSHLEPPAQATKGVSKEPLVHAFRGIYRAARIALGIPSSHLWDEYGQDADLVQQLSPILDFLYDRYWRVSVLGAEHIPEGPAILVANHSGAFPLDGPVLRRAIQRERPQLRQGRWLIEDRLFYLPFLGVLLNRIGAVRASPENAVRLLSERRPVIVFPEGVQGVTKSFSERYRLRPFGRGGFVKIAARTGAPIVPVAIVGAEEAMPVLAKLPGQVLGIPYLPLITPPLPVKWTIRFGAPIEAPIDPDQKNDPVEIQRCTERTRDSIAQMLQNLLTERRSIFAG